MRSLFLLISVFILALISPLHAGSIATVEQWGLFDTAFKGPADGNPFIDVKFSAEFHGPEKSLNVLGFYDGDGVYRLRFSPPSQGHWSYITKSNRAELNGQQGALEASAPTGVNHGPLRVYRTFHFQYADASPYYEIGTTCYAWMHQTEELQEQTLKTLAESPFNKMRMCIFPKSYIYNTNEPERFAFTRDAEGHFDFARFDPAFWRHLERRIADLEKLQIQADLILFHPYDRWGFAEMDKATDDRYLRYAIARLAVYRNVWWSLANEYDFMIPPLRNGQRGNKSMADFDRFFSILQNEDPYGRLRGIHHASKMYDHSKTWVTHASIQNRDLTKVTGWREKYQKPIVVDECRYEGNIPNSWGKLTGQEMVRQFWLGTICGGYVGHGETIKDPNDVLWWSKGGVLHGQSPPRIAFLRAMMEKLPYTEMTPSRVDENTFVLSKPGRVYLIYSLKEGAIKLQLPGDHDYAVRAIDTWEMKSDSLPAAKPGEFNFTAPRGDFLLYITAGGES